MSTTTSALHPNSEVRRDERTTAQPLTLGPVTLRNRLAAAPMERNYCDTEGHMTAQYQDYLVQRAAAGVALVTTEATYVRADGKGRTHQLGAHNDSCIAPLRRLADAIHAQGALVACELNHGGRTAQSAVSGHPNIAPSPVPCIPAGGEIPRELTTQECYDLARAYGQAADRCVRAGIDVLNIHAAHGYLIHQFMSPLSNHRSDEFADPARFLNLVIDEVRAAAATVALGIRVSVIEGPPGGLTADQTFDIISRAPLAKLDFIDLSAGSYEAGEWIVQSGEWPPGLLSRYAGRYRALGKPLGMAGRLNSPEIIEQVLRDGVTDFVSLARALHADPAFATACLEGGRYRPCIACNVCIDNLGTGQVACTVNPTVGRGRIPLATPQVRRGTTVAVTGAGPAGLTAARELAMAGADVTIYERRNGIGGTMNHAAAMTSTPDFHRFLEWSAKENERLGITVKLAVRAEPDELAARHPDIVIDATGGRAQTPVTALPDVQIAPGTEVLDVREWLDSRGTDAAPEAVTIYGADATGMSFADSLAGRATKVLLIGPETEIAPDAGRRSKILAVPRLLANPDVRVVLRSRMTAIDVGRVQVAGSDGIREWIDAPGPVLLSRGVLSGDPVRRNESIPAARRAGSVRGRDFGTIRHAISDGYDVAQQVAAQLR